LVGLLTLAGVTACGDKVTVPPPVTTPPDMTVHSVTVSPANATVAVGSKIILAASVDAGSGVTDRTVTWTSSDNTVATVGTDGTVTGVKAGTVTITAASHFAPDVKGAAAVTVGGGSTGPITVLISSINQTNAQGQSVPANLANAAGQLDVILNVDAGGAALKTVQATLTCNGKTMTRTQTIGAAAPVAADAAQATVTLSFPTNEFNATTGVPTLTNGPCTISASATTTTGTQSATNSQSLTLNNLDGVVITDSFAPITNAEGVTTVTTANDVNGLPWRGGAVTVSALPVLYSGRTISSVSITLPGANTATQTVTAAPYSATWSATSTSAPNVTRLTLVGAGTEANGVTPTGITPTVIVLDNQGNDLPLTVLNAGQPGNTTFRLDNTPPQPPTTFVIAQRQFGWTNASYTFTGSGGSSFGPAGTTKYVACGDGPAASSAAPPACATQIGVSANSVSGSSGVNGQTTFTYYAIPASSYSSIGSNGTSTSSSTCSTSGWTKIANAGDLAETLSNTSYVVRVFETDKLGNARCTDLANAQNTINSGTFANGTFGVDKTAPTDTLGGNTKDQQTIDSAFVANNGVPAFTNTYFDVPLASGFSSLPLLTTLTRLAIDPATGAASTSTTAFGCPIGFKSSNSTCAIGNTPAGGTIAVDAKDSTGASSAIDGYYTYNAQIIDNARNTGNTVTRSIVIDRKAPSMGGIAVPATITGGTSASFATSATDNLDLVGTDYTLSYNTTPSGAAQPLNIRATGNNIGTAFDNVLTTTASFNLTVPFFIRNVATTSAGSSPQANGVPAASITARVYDAAGNASTPPGATTINSANLPQNGLTDYTALQSNGATFQAFFVSTAGSNVSNCASCTKANPASVTLTADAMGSESNVAPAFQFQSPFSSVQFYYLDSGYAGASNEWILIGSSSSPGGTDNSNQTVRTYRWSVTWTPPAALPPGAANVIAIGVNSKGDALATANNTSVTLTNP
jgi:hypothetical protein